MKSVFEKYLSNTPKYANQIQIQIFHLVCFQIQIQIPIQIFAYLNTNTYLTPALLMHANVEWNTPISEQQRQLRYTALNVHNPLEQCAQSTRTKA